MKKKQPKTAQNAVGRIHPFKRAWAATTAIGRYNLATLLLVTLVSTVVGSIVMALALFSVMTLFLVLAAAPGVGALFQQVANLADATIPYSEINPVAALLLIILASLCIVGLSTLLTGLLQKVMLETQRAVKITFREVFRAVFGRRLFRLIFLAMFAAAINILILLVMLIIAALLATAFQSLDNILLVTVLSITGLVALAMLLLYINLRWFMYAPFVILDSNKTVLQAIYSSKQYFDQGVGYTFSLFLLIIAISLLFDLVTSYFIATALLLSVLISFISAVIGIGIIAIGYLDNKAATAEKTWLQPKRGMLFLAIGAVVVTAILSGVLQPEEPAGSPFPPADPPAQQNPYGPPVNQS